MKPNSCVKVSFHQNGEWGGMFFRATLRWEVNEWNDLFPDEDLQPYPVVEIDRLPGNGPWGGLIVHRGQEIPGKFADGYNSSLSGKFYLGEIWVGDTPHILKYQSVSSSVYPGPIGYLHVEESKAPTLEQRDLVVEAIRI